MKTLLELQKEFGARLVQLNGGQHGLRGGIHCNVTRVTVKDLTTDQFASIKTGAPMEDENGDLPCMDFISSDNTLDRYEEVINQDGWELDNFCANPVVPDCHDYSSVMKILARDLLSKAEQVQDGKLRCRAFFALDNPLGNLAWKMSRGGFIKSQSVGFIPYEWANGSKPGEPCRTYNKQELLEKSLVVVPANPGATIGLAMKSGAIQRGDVLNVVDFLKQFCSDEKPDPEGKGSASSAGFHDAQLLQMARSLKHVLTK